MKVKSSETPCVACFGLSQFSIGHGQLGICSQVIGPSRWLSLEGSRLAKAQRASGDQCTHVWKATFFHLTITYVCVASSKCLTDKIRRSRTMFHRHVCMASEYLFLDPFSPQTSRFIVPTAYPHLDAYYTIQMLNAQNWLLMSHLFVLARKAVCPLCPVVQLLAGRQLSGWNSQQLD